VARPQKRRANGSLGGIKRGLYSMFQRHLEFVEDPESDHETCVKSANTAGQLALAYMKLCELLDLETDMQRYEHLVNGNGNGHQP
jgi:hypothetical protein